MTIEKALAKMKITRLVMFNEPQEDIECVRISIECMEKQIPKKPNVEGRTKDVVCCSVCGLHLRVKKDNFCPECGQRIDWSDEEWRLKNV